MAHKAREQNSGFFNNALKQLTQPFIDLFHSPRSLLGVSLVLVIGGLTYAGTTGLLAVFFNEYIGLGDITAHRIDGFLTAGLALAVLFLGVVVDWAGVRKALLAALSFMLIGRVLMISAPALDAPGMWGPAHIVVLTGLLVIILGFGIFQPTCYAAVKKYTHKKTAAMGYAVLYALLNLGFFLPALISPPVRQNFGITGVFWIYLLFTGVGILIVISIVSKRKQIIAASHTGDKGKQKINAEKDDIEDKSAKDKIGWYMKNFPIKDVRFMFFIFILIPVQTLFAHITFTLPHYTGRAFEGFVSENFEVFVYLNPLLIFVLTPIVTALTSKKNTYTMMVAGTFVMAAPTFILALGPNFYTLMGYLVIMSIGEAMWQPRYLQWVAEMAPKGMTGIYMGIGQFPWFLTKIITGLYAGWFLVKYCPADTPVHQLNTETMWLVYGLIAVVSPTALLLARKWMMGTGFKRPVS